MSTMETMQTEAYPRQLTEAELAGLGRISLAVNASETNEYLDGFRAIDEELIGKIHSAKVPNGQIVGNGLEETHTNQIGIPDQLAVKVADMGAPRMILDSKFSNDGSELYGSIKSLAIHAHSARTDLYLREQAERHMSRGDALLSLEGFLPPAFITVEVTHLTDVKELREARRLAHDGDEAEGIPAMNAQLIAMVSSSKKADEEFEKYGWDLEGAITSSTLMSIDAGIHHIMSAAKHAKIVRRATSHLDQEIQDKIHISGTGAVLDEENKGEHEAWSYVSQTKQYVDSYWLGSPVLRRPNQNERLLRFAAAIGHSDRA